MASPTAEQHIAVPVLRASWETLTFVHWRVAPEHIQPLLPSGLTVDVYDGSAWVGLTPFVMANMRPLGVPDLPPGFPAVARHVKAPRLRDVFSTAETNLRTYIRGPDGRDGLWFLSLDIASAPLAMTLRAAVGAPYHRGHLTVEERDNTYLYTGSRSGGGPNYRLEVHAGEPIAAGEFEVWLTGRWRAYTVHLGRLLVTPVEHETWPLREARVDALDQDLTDSAGLAFLSEPAVAHFSEGVHKVRIGRPAMASG